MPTRIRATFGSPADAEFALQQLADIGLPADAITLATEPAQREGAFITRLVVAIVLWSILGGAVGVGLGTAIWLILGPSGGTGFVIQAVVWGIFGHLIAGLWAGYLLLADRTEADLPHDRSERAAFTISCPDENTAGRARDLIQSHGGVVAGSLTRAAPPATVSAPEDAQGDAR
jgi:hypothetical protein